MQNRFDGEAMAKSVLPEKDLFIFDMDGTIYLGGRTFDFAVKFINSLREKGKRVLFFTNNASHSGKFYMEKLTRMGFSPSENEIMTAGDVTIQFLLRRRAGKKVYLLGTPDLKSDFEAVGIDLAPDDGSVPAVDVAVTSFDTTLTYDRLSLACKYIREGAEYLCTHPDFNCPTEDGFIPDSGAIAAAVTASTGKRPVFFGKPGAETVEMICEYTGVDRDKMVIFGDRLYTDIAAGKRHGITSVLVLTGETQPADLDAADDADLPDIVLPSLAEAEF